MEIYISDITAVVEQDLLHDKEYRVSLNTGQYENRFFLNFLKIGTEIPDIAADDELFNIYYSSGILKLDIKTLPDVEGTLSIWNLTGQILLVRKYYEPGYYEINPGLRNGIYIANFSSGKKRSSKKFSVLNR